MSKKQRKALTEKLVSLALTEPIGAIHTDSERYWAIVYQHVADRPYTMVQVEAGDKVPLGVFKTYGFAKVCYPDRYDERIGFELAVRKACAKIARKMGG
jgi:hypothetical protein